jgi:F1F0 ATPase subunit 2
MSAFPLFLLAAALAGALLGAAYMAILWIAVRRLPEERGGASFFLAMAAVRAALVLGALAGAGALGVPASGILAALLGFVAARLAATRLSAGGETGDVAWK